MDLTDTWWKDVGTGFSLLRTGTSDGVAELLKKGNAPWCSIEFYHPPQRISYWRRIMMGIFGLEKWRKLCCRGFTISIWMIAWLRVDMAENVDWRSEISDACRESTWEAKEYFRVILRG
jgi:hypothetical protein